MEVTHYLNGVFVPEEKLLISPRDLGFTRGFTIFDFFRTYSGHKPFMFDDHISRLFNSAASIGLMMPWTKEEIKSIVIETLRQNDTSKEFVVRIMVSGGISPTLTPASKPTLIVIVDEAISFPKSMYSNGIKVSTMLHKRYRPGSKTTHYIEAVQHMEAMYADGSDEMLFVHDGSVLEGAFSNFFCIIDGKLVTPKDDILPGITRKVVIEKLKLNIPVEVRELKFDELGDATEAFISVSGKGVVPVVQVDNIMIGNRQVGPLTKDIVSKFDAFVEGGGWY